jgi:hypothetical protein
LEARVESRNNPIFISQSIEKQVLPTGKIGVRKGKIARAEGNVSLAEGNIGLRKGNVSLREAK